MSRRMLAVLAATLMALAVLIPAVSNAEYRMYVYTANGKNLNVRTSPETGDNILKTLPFGSEVYVDYHLGNGWTALMWTGESCDHVYVQTRFLVDKKPTKKPTQEETGGKTEGSGTIAELNKVFKTYRYVSEPYRIIVRPTRASGWVNMRFAPSKQAELISTHRTDDELLVIAEYKDWYQVEDPDTGAVGYISSKFVVK